MADFVHLHSEGEKWNRLGLNLRILRDTRLLTY